ncbi:MAG: prepilin-type N-terminal cleavage/methylation domain-containing protein [Candidatus Omnitrophica bacterium]|nr:prepilin-type N-terminal cleavage/methylation domain-containing protein [Candidatus Omnitrophota bacterium]
MNKKNGFTLIELMLVSVIFSLLILSIFSAFRTGLLSHEKIDAAANLYQKARLSLSLIEAELKNAFVYAESDSKFMGSPESMDFFSILDVYDKEGKIFSNIGRIRYKILDHSLTRKVSQGILALKAVVEEEGESFLSGVEKLSLQFAAPSTVPDKLCEWQDLWPKEGVADQKKQLPIAVKIKLVLKQKDNSLVEFNKIMPFYAK